MVTDMLKKRNDVAMFPVIEQADLATLKTIMDDEYPDVLKRFLEESLSLMNAIHISMEENHEQLLTAIEVLVIGSKEVGARRLAVYLQKLQTMMKKKQITMASELLAEIDEIFTETHRQLKKEVDVKDKRSA